MIVVIIIIGVAWGWLMVKTDWLRIRLMVGEHHQLDMEPDYDGSNSVYLDDYQLQLDETLRDYQYQCWLDKRYEVKYSWGSLKENTIDHRDKWLKVEEDLAKRRRGEMLYQRIK